MSTQAPDASPDNSESVDALLSEAEVLLLLDGDTEKSAEDSSSSLVGTLSSEQNLLLSFLASFLQGNSQPHVDMAENSRLVASQDSRAPTPLTPQVLLPVNLQSASFLPSSLKTQEGEQVPQSLIAQPALQSAMQTPGQKLREGFSLSSTTAVDSMVDSIAPAAELAPLLPEADGSEEIFSSRLSPTLSSFEGDSTVSLAKQGKEPEKARIATSNMGATERGVIVRRYAAVGEGGERKPTGTSPLTLGQLAENEQSVPHALVALGTQEAEVVGTTEEGNATQTATLGSKDHALTGHSRNMTSQPEANPLVQKAGGGVSSVQTEQLIASLSSRGKNHETVRDRTPFSSGAEVFAANGPGNNATVVLQPRPEGPVRAANFESWRQVVDQVGEGIITNIQQDNREARLYLTPPELGKLDIQLVVESDRIRAHIVAESADVGALIQSHLPELKQALQTHRLDLETVRVDVQTSGGEPNTFSQQPRQDERGRDHGRALPFSSKTEPDTGPVRRLSAPSGHSGRVSVWA